MCRFLTCDWFSLLITYIDKYNGILTSKRCLNVKKYIIILSFYKSIEIKLSCVYVNYI